MSIKIDALDNTPDIISISCKQFELTLKQWLNPIEHL
nr:hypothetical protein CJLB15_00046 [Campylobacter phage CJLB-15]